MTIAVQHCTATSLPEELIFAGIAWCDGFGPWITYIESALQSLLGYSSKNPVSGHCLSSGTPVYLREWVSLIPLLELGQQRKLLALGKLCKAVLIKSMPWVFAKPFSTVPSKSVALSWHSGREQSSQWIQVSVGVSNSLSECDLRSFLHQLNGMWLLAPCVPRFKSGQV